MTRIYDFQVTDRSLDKLELTFRATWTYEDWRALEKRLVDLDQSWPVCDLTRQVKEMLRQIRKAVEPHIYEEASE